MKLAHQGININDSHWTVFIAYIHETLKELGVESKTFDNLVSFASSLKDEIVDLF
ncbi:MAG: hypothetical protein MK132_11900 [Lentisphaerales bacterium]|nr:hypothetical protein [Lentisphaerales bacterium]